MADGTIARHQLPHESVERRAVSYLVRFWWEPQEADQESHHLRGYVRDLKTGEERYFKDPRSLSEHILARFETSRSRD